jgi:hypothetical protein
MRLCGLTLCVLLAGLGMRAQDDKNTPSAPLPAQCESLRQSLGKTTRERMERYNALSKANTSDELAKALAFPLSAPIPEKDEVISCFVKSEGLPEKGIPENPGGLRIAFMALAATNDYAEASSDARARAIGRNYVDLIDKYRALLATANEHVQQYNALVKSYNTLILINKIQAAQSPSLLWAPPAPLANAPLQCTTTQTGTTIPTWNTSCQ